MSTRPAAPPLSAGTHLFQRTGDAVPALTPRKWKIGTVGVDAEVKWCAFQPWAGRVYWMRFFDSFHEASVFVKDAIAKASVTK